MIEFPFLSDEISLWWFWSFAFGSSSLDCRRAAWFSIPASSTPERFRLPLHSRVGQSLVFRLCLACLDPISIQRLNDVELSPFGRTCCSSPGIRGIAVWQCQQFDPYSRTCITQTPATQVLAAQTRRTRVSGLLLCVCSCFLGRFMGDLFGRLIHFMADFIGSALGRLPSFLHVVAQRRSGTITFSPIRASSFPSIF
jgi:hypothetical protein